jgi:hypothetical protein
MRAIRLPNRSSHPRQKPRRRAVPWAGRTTQPRRTTTVSHRLTRCAPAPPDGRLARITPVRLSDSESTPPSRYTLASAPVPPAALAQSAERLTRNEKVVGSIPTGGSTQTQVIASEGRFPRLGVFAHGTFDAASTFCDRRMTLRVATSQLLRHTTQRRGGHGGAAGGQPEAWGIFWCSSIYLRSR